VCSSDLFPIIVQAQDAPPNIVMIISDDQMWSDFGFMKHPQIETPSLDKLASQSLLFPNGYVPTSLCRPSLMTLATGLYPHQHKVTGNEPPIPKGGKRTPEYIRMRHEMIKYIDKVPSLPRTLAKKGYVSHQSGKWWEGNFRRGGFTHGMTKGFPNPGGRHGDAGLAIGRQGMQPIFDFIDSADKKPFFIYYAPFLPHTPHTPPKRLLDKYRSKTDSLFVAKYWAMCEWFDETCGQLLDYLDKKQLADNTLVLFVIDNGWIQQSKRRGYAPKSKRSQYDGGLRSPIMVRWPKRIKPAVIETPVNSIDFAPTILAAVGLEPTQQMRGVNLLDLEAVKKRKAIYGEVFGHNAIDIHRPAANLHYRWCREGNWKLIVPNNANVDGAVELYNLDADPLETKNLATKHPDRTRRLGTMIDAWWKAD
jgi:uncharacterized sulfatase